MDSAPLLAALAAFLGAAAFLLRALGPIVALWVREDVDARKAQRQDLERVRADLEAAEKRVLVLEAALASAHARAQDSE